ncbi:hypothetical protein CAOG_07788 [Capsaspora owczarzaki ATCC 30864]|nr:hypothetical protein CAOG_07788 [Capsaspora owczarzaki ATCC 30864]|eukprot:XP_004342861.2 hypothetical protein CAOG_07788 [Capsaspora owczarzaki ATCC 30864]
MASEKPPSIPTFEEISDAEIARRYPADLELKLVQVVHRHGARTAVSARLDKYHPATWTCTPDMATVDAITQPDPTTMEHSPAAFYRLLHVPGRQPLIGTCYWGQLTAHGRQQLVDLGQNLRHLYVDRLQFLSPQCNVNDIYVRSTTIRRAIESVQNLMLGLYPPSTRVPTAASASPVVVDIHTLHEKVETMYPNYSACRRLGEMKKEMQAAPPMTELAKQMEQVRVRTATAMGIDPAQLSSSLHGIYDELVAREAHGLPLPTGVTRDMIKEIELLCVQWWFADLKRALPYRRLAIGRFMQEVLADMLHIAAPTDSVALQQQTQALAEFSTVAVERDASASVSPKTTGPSPLKFMAFSGHDTTLAPTLIALGYDLKEWPGFASNIAFELFQERTQARKHVVRVLYNNRPFAMPGCAGAARDKAGEFCPLDKFAEVVAQNFPLNFQEECKSARE